MGSVQLQAEDAALLGRAGGGDHDVVVAGDGRRVDAFAEVEREERVAQLAIVPYLKAEFEEADSLSDTDRGAGGFGSTGRK